MRTVTFSMGTTLDGFIAGPGGDISWSAPSEELFAFHYEQASELAAHLMGRRLYETMLYWEDPPPETSGLELEWAQMWRALPKVVFSSTLGTVRGTNTRLASGSLEEELAALPDGEIGVGGAELAASLAEQGLIDEYRVFVHPAVIGAGTPYFPPGLKRNVELVETREFPGGVVYLRYR